MLSTVSVVSFKSAVIVNNWHASLNGCLFIFISKAFTQQVQTNTTSSEPRGHLKSGVCIVLISWRPFCHRSEGVTGIWYVLLGTNR
jgi:hypothetical protein